MNFLTTVLFERNSLASRVTRELIGERVVNLAEDYIQTGGNDDGGFFSQIFNFGKKFVGFVVKAVFSVLIWTFADLWDVAVEAYFELKYFDWNQTDAQLREQLKANDTAIAGAMGRLTGTGLVWLAGVGVSTALSFKFPVLAGRVALELAQEGGFEIRSALTNLIYVSRQAAIESTILGGLLNARKLELFGLKPVNESKKPWTINDGIENFIDTFSSDKLRAFVTQAIDAIEDAVIEMGYVIAYTLDDFYLSQRVANESLLGQNRTIELTPDIRVPDERIILEAPQELAIATTQTAIVEHQLIHNRDVGQIAGMPEDDYITPAPQRRKLKIVFRGKKTPPWKLPDGIKAMQAEVNIPDTFPSVTWDKLKRIIQPYTWGKYRVTAHLSNGRQMRVHAVSWSEGERQLREYIKLSSAEITRISHGVTATDNANPDRRIVPTVVYPAYAKLTVGDVRADGSLRSHSKKTTRVELWVDEEPSNADDLRTI